MPNRIIKESICSSEDLDQLKPFEEIVFYRVIVNCDDYGRLDARPAFLKSKLFVTRQGITLQNIEDAIRKLASVGLVNLYTVNEKPFLLLPKWGLHQRIRAKESKYPAPDGNGCQVTADDSGCPRNPIQSESKSPLTPQGEDDLFCGFSDRAKEAVKNWIEYKTEKNQKYKSRGLQTLLSEIKNNISKHGESAVIELINACMAANYTGIIFDKLKDKPRAGEENIWEGVAK